ncbi:hypothetical protein [Methylobacterium oryzihabitans]|uniref:Uncharacterized protein n=1 Tax=Methylobacterium oryzihabitans TaxID=2499852 RepID=A0A3S2XMM7_9HYPH|nr:hypothetical protein [Methylobacterium oryzihabitans]RVU18480.1 hypothetical protein EOE48_11395 [Methylobacterium oryzihabitans]
MAEQLRLPQLRSHLTPERRKMLVGRLLAQIDPADVDGAIAAVELLGEAPQDFVDEAVSRLRQSAQLERVFAVASEEQKSIFRNSAVINRVGLREVLWRDHLESFRAALASNSDATIVALLSSAQSMTRLPAPLADALLDALEADRLGEQARHETARVLTGKWESLDKAVPRLRRWLSAQDPANEAAALRERTARAVLVRLGQPLSSRDLERILNEGGPEARLVALDQLRRVAPERWARLYRVTDQPTALDAWDLKTVRQFIEMAGPEQLPALARWTATLTLPSARSDALECPDLTWRLALLSRQPTPRASKFATLWGLLTKRSSCRMDLSRQVDTALVEVADADLGLLVLAALGREGPGQLANMPLRLPSLTRSLTDELAARLAMGDETGARALLDVGVLPSVTALEARGYWKVFGGDAVRALTVTDLRVLQSVEGAPTTAYAAAARLAADARAGTPIRSAALLALADHPETGMKAFIDNLSDTSVAVARTALILLARAYDSVSATGRLPVPDAESVGLVRTRPDLSDDATVLLRSLIRHDQSFAASYADSVSEDQWRTKPGELCLAQALAATLKPALLAPAFNALHRATNRERDAILACVLLLSEAGSPLAGLAGAWRDRPVPDPPKLLEGIRSLWEDESFRNATSREVGARIAEIVGRAVDDLPYLPASMPSLEYWRDQFATTAPEQSKTIASEFRKRWILAGLAGIPVALLAHLALWALLLTAYPRSPRLQAVVFWNPVLRRLLGLGYIDLVLLHVGVARRRLFAPFKESFLGDIASGDVAQLDRLSYFQDSRVRHRATVMGGRGRATETELPLLNALSGHRGRVLLLGKSGLGKSSFLRFSLAARAREGRDVLVYMRADQCRRGVEAEIEQRMNGLGKEQSLLKAMIYSGNIFIYIDGYNEVDLATQDLITGFLSQYPYASILVASQIPLRGFGTIESYTILPLAPEAVRAFLVSREPVLADDAPVRGELFVKSAECFLQEVASAPKDDVERRAFEEFLSNPMDLTSVALLLGDGRTPDLFALEAQQFEGISRRLAESGVTFRTTAFSSALLEQRLKDQENLQKLPFQPEVVALIAGKLALVRTDADEGGAIASQEVRFRHDRIRDFFSHFALLVLDQEARARYAEDARFAGVFPYLARALPGADAEDLRERLITRAAEIEDHRVSDSFVREYSWRLRISSQDPEWLLLHDLPEARDADRKLCELAERRRETDNQVNGERDVISKARAMTRILAASDEGTLRDAAATILREMGAVADDVDGVASGRLRGPAGRAFRVVGLGQTGRIRRVHVEILAIWAKTADSDLLVVTNACVAQEPGDRPPDLDESDARLLEDTGMRVISARRLYAAFVEARASGGTVDFWRHLGIEAETSVEPA